MARPCQERSGNGDRTAVDGASGRRYVACTMKKTITQTTRQTLGVSVNPHLFRACAATTAALHASDHPRLRAVCSST